MKCHFSGDKLFHFYPEAGVPPDSEQECLLVLGHGSQVVSSGSWVIDWKGSALAALLNFLPIYLFKAV